METARWRRIEELYHSALEREGSDRATFVEQACDGDESLRREVESLLAQARDTENFLESPALDLAARDLATSREPGTPSHPASIGRYRIIRLLGEGGMGTVYEAEQEEPRRVVALKVIKLGLAAPDRLRRFRRESQALARLQHPGIAQIYESSTADAGFGPQPFFAMEFIRGLPLKKYAEAHQINTRQKLVLMVKICEAVHHAHQRGLIHRDLKPNNILVDETGQPKILDFGVARVTESDAPEGDSQPTMQTDLGQLVGTLAYMSPEQVLGDPLEVDTRSDVYALGVILYELLSGRLPYQVNYRQLPEAVHTIRDEEPASLSSIDRDYRGDIETLVRKALEKHKTRRYTSAADLGADIQRYLNDEPIMARPPSAGYQLQKFSRRHRGLMAGMAAVFVVLLTGVAVSTSQAIRANRAGQAALSQRDRAIAAEANAVQERNRALAEKQRADDEAASAKAVNDFLQNGLLAQASASAQARPGTKPDPDLKVRTALDRAASSIAGTFDKQPLVEASIRKTIGNTYLDLGIFPEAERQIERSLELRRRLLGEDHPDTLASLRNLAILYRRQDKPAEAETLLTKVLDAQRRVLGKDHPDTLESAHDLALVYYDQEKFAQAEPLLIEALDGQRRTLGEKHPSTARTMNNLAELYKDEGKFARAEPLHLRALEIQRSVLGKEHPDTLDTMNSLAVLYEAEGKTAQAERLYTNVLGVQRRVLGAEHTGTLVTMNNLANLLRTEGRYPEAESLQTRTLEIQRRVLGEEAMETTSTMNNLAVTYQVQGKYAQAEAFFTKLLEIRRRTSGEENPATALAMNNLAVLSGKEGKWAQAEPFLANALAIRRRVLGDDHPLTLITMCNLGFVYQMQGRYAQAEPLSVRAFEGLRRVEGEEHNDSLICTNLLGLLYRSEGKYAQAESLLMKALAIRRRILGVDHPDTIKSMNSLASLYRSEGKDAEAETLLAAVLEARRRVLGPMHPDTTSVMALLGEVRLQQKKYADAEALLREARNNGEKTPADSWERYWSQNLLGASLAGQSQYAEAEPLMISGYQGMLQREAAIPLEDRLVLSQAGERIVQLYEKWQRPEKAAEWRQRLQPK
jgi:tetratricopeptide (TPR) repeat protein/predicted Ser/Thr protein kinase